jgi:hypothetical protein
MLAAYLRGLLKASSEFGLRSFHFEDVLLEAMTADISVQNFRLSVAADAAIAGILTEDSKRDTMRRIQRQTQRHAALQLMDIYDLASGARRQGMDSETGRISLLQLFQLMRKEGIIPPDELPADDPAT